MPVVAWTKTNGGLSVQDGAETPATPIGSLEPVVFPIPRWTVFALAAGCLAFVLLGLFIIDIAGSNFGKTVGVISIVFFGAGGGFAVLRMLRVPVVLTLSEEGILVQAGGFIPWDDVEEIGTGRTGAGPAGPKIIGIRLKSSERYIASFTPEEQRLMRGTARAGRVAGAALRNAPMRSTRRGARQLGSLPQRDPAAMVQWVRNVSGWDVTLSPLVFGRPSAGVIRDIETYHQAVRKRRRRF